MNKKCIYKYIHSFSNKEQRLYRSNKTKNHSLTHTEIFMVIKNNVQTKVNMN